MFAQSFGAFTLVLVALTWHVESINGSESQIETKTSTIAECGLYLVPSKIPELGRGIVAGKFIAKGQIMDHSVTLAIKYDDMSDTQISNYVFGTHEDDIAMTELGMDMLYNHAKLASLKRNWDSSVLTSYEDQQLAHSTYPTVVTSSATDIEAGEEIFSSYGDDDWFDYRNITLSSDMRNTQKYTAEELQKKGVCMTDARVMKSKLSFAGKGLFARRDFLQGDLVTVSPVLLIPKDLIAYMAVTSGAILQNYCIASPYSSIVIFPFTNGALANHATSKNTNIELDWYWWKTDDGDHNSERDRKTSSSLLELSKAPYAQLDLSYKATRDIKKGEELFYSYGEEWQDAWTDYLAEVSEWSVSARRKAEVEELERALSELKGSCVGDKCEAGPVIEDLVPVEDIALLDAGESEMPQFREFIGGLDRLFYPAWRDLDPENPVIGRKTEAADETKVLEEEEEEKIQDEEDVQVKDDEQEEQGGFMGTTVEVEEDVGQSSAFSCSISGNNFADPGLSNPGSCGAIGSDLMDSTALAFGSCPVTLSS